MPTQDKKKEITYEDCKKIVAKKQGWNKLVMGHAVKHFDEATELYASIKYKEMETINMGALVEFWTADPELGIKNSLSEVIEQMNKRK